MFILVIITMRFPKGASIEDAPRELGLATSPGKIVKTRRSHTQPPGGGKSLQPGKEHS
ncbi:MAG: hypothetical protein K9M45_00635 [Kiritimatiellales bacterium]|nr:hypothetical protein [Kiritimatiellales bacterium]